MLCDCLVQLSFCASLITIVDDGTFQALSGIVWLLLEAANILPIVQEEHFKPQKGDVQELAKGEFEWAFMKDFSVSMTSICKITKQQKKIQAFSSA